MQDNFKLTRLFGKFSGAHLSPPPVVEIQGTWYMYPTDNDKYVCLSSSQDGINWSEPSRLFADWGWIKGTPALAFYKGEIYMYVASGDGTIYQAISPDGYKWPLAPAHIGGDFRSPRSGPSLTIINGALHLIVLDHNGTPFIAEVPGFGFKADKS